MVVQRKRESSLDALILQATADIQRANPCIGVSAALISNAATEDALAEIVAVDAMLARLWDSPEREQVRQLGYSAAQAGDKDRGE